MLSKLEIMTPDARMGSVFVSGEMDESVRVFLDGLVVPGGLRPGDPGYLEALYSLLRSGSYLWAQPLSDGGI